MLLTGAGSGLTSQSVRAAASARSHRRRGRRHDVIAIRARPVHAQPGGEEAQHIIDPNHDARTVLVVDVVLLREPGDGHHGA